MNLILIIFTVCMIPGSLCKRRVPTDYDQIEQTIYSSFNTLTESNNLRVHTRKLEYATNAKDHLVTNLPGLDPSSNLVHYSGYLPIDSSGQGQLFYWLFESAVDSEKAPLVIWLNGGPGCSSMDGLFLELGPLRISGEKRDHIKINPNSWHNIANILFIDQPVGTGLSYTTQRNLYAKNDETIATHFYYFMEQFFKLHPKYLTNPPDSTTATTTTQQKTRPMYFTGESHAGHYIPYLTSFILKKNEITSTNIYMDIHGMALGNPWISPYHQYDVSDFVHSLGLISLEQKYKLMEMNRICQQHLNKNEYNVRVCYNLLDDVIDASAVDRAHKVTMYDIRKYLPGGYFPYGHLDVENYLNRQDVRQSIHAIDISQHIYRECADPPYEALQHQDGLGVMSELSYVLNHPTNVNVLIYSGQYDIICNHIGVENVLRQLNWSHHDSWTSQSPGVYLYDNQVAGYVKSYKNLMSLLILNSGHMVPMDQPAISLDMIRKFINQHSDDMISGRSRLASTSQLSSELQCLPMTPKFNN